MAAVLVTLTVTLRRRAGAIRDDIQLRITMVADAPWETGPTVMFQARVTSHESRVAGTVIVVQLETRPEPPFHDAMSNHPGRRPGPVSI